MLPGEFDHAADTRTLTPYVIVAGISRDVESVSLDRELSHDLPEQVGGAHGLGAASGRIVWAEQPDVSNRPVSPWHNPGSWPPAPGDRVQIYVTDGTTSYPRFSGVIDQSSGDPTGLEFESQIIDDRDKLNRRCDMIALLRHHTPHLEDRKWRSIGLNQFYVLTAVLRQAGIYNMPPPAGVTAVSVPMQSSMWPEVGLATEVYGEAPGAHSLFRHTPWGYAAESFNGWYEPTTSQQVTAPTQISFQLAEDHAGVFYIDARYATGQRIRVRGWTGERRVTAQYYNGSAWTSVVSLSHAHMEGATVVSLLVKNGVWELRNNNNRATSATQQVSGGAMSQVYLHGDDNAQVAGVSVTRPSASQEHRAVSFTPQMTIVAGELAVRMDMSPRIEAETVAKVVDDICDATLTAAWWDEVGVLRFEAADTLRGRRPVQTLTTLNDITRIQWAQTLRSTRRAVEITWQDASVSKGYEKRKELFRGSRDSMTSGDVIEVFARPGSDKEWFGADLNPRRLNDSNWGAINRGKQSRMGVYYIDADGDERPTSTWTTTIRTERVNQVTLKIIHEAGAYSVGAEAYLGISENAPAVREHLRGDPLPVIRGYGEGTWVDETTTSAALGPASAPDLAHDLGKWGHRYSSGSAAQRMADWLMGQLATPKPLLTGLAVTYDPRRQLGDVYIIDSQILGVQLRVGVIGIRETLTHGEATQSFDVRLIDATSTRSVTYDELAQAWDGGDYQGLQAVWTNLTYTDMTESPTEGAPNQ